MLRPMRQNKRATSTQKAYQLLQKGEYGILSTADNRGQPYGVPLNYVLFNDRVYFHCAPEGHKLSNLGVNPKVSFCVVVHTTILPDKFSTKYESVIVFGTVQEAADNEKQAAFKALIKSIPQTTTMKGWHISWRPVRKRMFSGCPLIR